MSFAPKDPSWDYDCRRCGHSRRFHTTTIVDKNCFSCDCERWIPKDNLLYLEWVCEQSCLK